MGIHKILEDHKVWLAGNGGARADLRRADPYGTVMRKDIRIPGHLSWDRERFVIQCTSVAGLSYRVLIESDGSGRERFTHDEMRDFTCARAHTLVPIHEYGGGYEDPVILIHRELDFDEVEILFEFPGERW